MLKFFRQGWRKSRYPRRRGRGRLSKLEGRRANAFFNSFRFFQVSIYSGAAVPAYPAAASEVNTINLLQEFFYSAQPEASALSAGMEWLFGRVHGSSAELFCFPAACAGRMLVSIEAEHACFDMIPIGIVSMSIGIRLKSTGIGAFSIGIMSIPTGNRAMSIGNGPIPIGIRLIPAGIVSIQIENRAIPIDIDPISIENAPVQIGIRPMQARFWLPLRAFSRSWPVLQRMTRQLSPCFTPPSRSWPDYAADPHRSHGGRRSRRPAVGPG